MRSVIIEPFSLRGLLIVACGLDAVAAGRPCAASVKARGLADAARDRRGAKPVQCGVTGPVAAQWQPSGSIAPGGGAAQGVAVDGGGRYAA